MASSTNGGAKVVREVIARCLAAKSDLFAHGKITPATSDDEFIRRLNTLVHADAQAWAADVPKNLEDAIRADKKAKPEAELVLFGHWLLLEGRPGLQKTSGKKPDYHEIMKCVAACLFGPRSRERRAPNKDRLVRAASTNVVNRSSHPRPNSRTKDITKHDLRDWWTKMFDESRQASDFDAKLKSMRRLLRAYLSHLQSGTVTHGGKTVTKSPRVSAVLDAISGTKEFQHKIADQRNPVSGTKQVLPDDERRARVEVTLSGADILEERGLGTINDLGRVSFKKLTRPFLSFRLGTTGARQHLLDDAAAQMRTRGVYGLDLRERARQAALARCGRRQLQNHNAVLATWTSRTGWTTGVAHMARRIERLGPHGQLGPS